MNRSPNGVAWRGCDFAGQGPRNTARTEGGAAQAPSPSAADWLPPSNCGIDLAPRTWLTPRALNEKGAEPS